MPWSSLKSSARVRRTPMRRWGTVARHRGAEGGTPAEPHSLSLLDLEEAVGSLPPLSFTAGITSDGVPLIFDLRRPGTAHLFVVGPAGAGKSTLLRTVVGSLCLHASPGQLAVLAIDPTHRELSVIEAIPHRLSGLAQEVDEAGVVLGWLKTEAEVRTERGIHTPGLILVIDDLDWIEDPDQGESLERLKAIVRMGGRVGIHVIGAASRWPKSLLRANSSGVVLAKATAGATEQGTGGFAFETPDWRSWAQVACLSARDLNGLVERLAGSVAAARRSIEIVRTRSRIGGGAQ